MDIGEKIKRLRILNQLTQEELALRCDLTKGFISKVERNLTSPSISTLMDILEVLGTDLKSFFDDAIDDKVVYGKDDIYTSYNEHLKTTIQWLIPNSQKNIMEPILMEIPPGQKTEVDRPHAGEEFGYVLRGTILLTIGKRQFKLKKGESFYFSPNEEHSISNISGIKAEILWVSSPPSF